MEENKEDIDKSENILKTDEIQNTSPSPTKMASDEAASESEKNEDTENEGPHLGDDYVVIDEITASQATADDVREEDEESVKEIDLTAINSDGTATTTSEMKENASLVKSDSEVTSKVSEESDVKNQKLKNEEEPMDLDKTQELVRLPTPPPLIRIEKNEHVPSTLEMQIQQALDTVMKESESNSNVEDVKKSEEVVDLLDDEEESEKETGDTNTDENAETKPSFDHECINPKCENTSNDFMPARKFIVNHFRQNGDKLSKKQFVCSPCYDLAVEKYRDYTKALLNHQPLYKMEMPAMEDVVELLSDGEDSDDEEMSENAPVQKETLNLLSTELTSVIEEQLKKIDIDKQMGWNWQIIQARTENNEKMLDENNRSLLELEKKANIIYRKLYAVNEVQYYNLPTMEIVSSTDGNIYKEKHHLPSVGPVERPQINLSSVYFAVKQRLLSTWCQCKVVDVIEEVASKLHHFRVQFIDSKVNNIRVVSPKQIAYGHPPTTRLPVGERVIALFKDETYGKHPNIPGTVELPRHFYPGVIAEPLQPYNMFRYLIFFDDGYTQYVTPQDVRLVHSVSSNVWDDVHPHSKQFVENYLKTFKEERPLVQAHKNQRIVTELKGKWQPAKVLEVDASLVRVYFLDAKKTEWIYRGSTRLAPLYKKSNDMNAGGYKNRNEPSIEYVTMSENDAPHVTRPQTQNTTNGTGVTTTNRAVARKSSAGGVRPHHNISQTQQQRQQLQQQRQEQREKVKFMNRNTIILDDDSDKGRVVYYTAKQNVEEKKFMPHNCGPSCLRKLMHDLKNYSPTAKPLLSGWKREIAKVKLKRTVYYQAPCGRRLRDIDEVYKYLKMTECRLGIECFDFDNKLHCLASYVTDKAFYSVDDISNGLEGMPVPCVNCYDDTKPPPCEYSANRIPTEGVNLVTDPAFMCGCDCTNDCIDKNTCACQQLTIAGAKFSNPNTPPEQVGYQYKRLHEQISAGIYECNPNCKCSRKTCLNRVVQHPIQNKLQLFKTYNMGWGLRAITDIPKGTFICIYAGNLLTDEKANTDLGDEYFADLDYIEIVEQLKNGYESDAPEMTDESDYDPNEDEGNEDREFVPSTASASRSTRSVRSTRSSASVEQLMERAAIKETENASGSTPASRSGSDDEDTREKINLMPQSGLMEQNEDSSNSKFCSLRKLYGKNESVYVMDAKICGNIGRYFNHSCDPNLFVQNVFVDTHDLRFPWIAFFSSRYIKAGTELTWDYNYEVGSIPDKRLYCECGSSKCRIRLL